MTSTEADRLRLHHRLEQVLGPDEASTLMDHLLPLGWTDVATKQDLDALRLLTRADLDAAAAGLRTEIADLRTELRGEMADLRTELRGEMADLRTDLRGELADLRVEVHRGFRSQTVTLIGAMFAALSLYSGLLIATLG